MPFDRVVDYLQDILREIDLSEKFVGSLTQKEFEADELRLRAVVRCLEIISEAPRRLPDDLKARHPHIQWRSMAGSGNVYRHNYEDVLAWKIWETFQSLSQLRNVIDKELQR